MVSAAFLALTLSIKSCAEDKETVSGYTSAKKKSWSNYTFLLLSSIATLRVLSKTLPNK